MVGFDDLERQLSKVEQENRARIEESLRYFEGEYHN